MKTLIVIGVVEVGMTKDGANQSRMLKTLLNGVEIIDLLRKSGKAGVTEIAEELGISKGTACTYLKTLEEGELIVQPNEKYELSKKFLVIGEYVRNQQELYRKGKKKIDRLADETAHYAHIVVEENGRGINLYQAKGSEAIGDEYQEAKFHHRDYLHMTAAGKAILAQLPPETFDEIIDRHGLPANTENTITDRNLLSMNLEEIRDRGYALNDEEEIEGFRAVAAPIMGRDGDVLGSLSVSGPTSFLSDENFHETIPEKVTQTANIIEVDINMANRSEEIDESV